MSYHQLVIPEFADEHGNAHGPVLLRRTARSVRITCESCNLNVLRRRDGIGFYTADKLAEVLVMHEDLKRPDVRDSAWKRREAFRQPVGEWLREDAP